MANKHPVLHKNLQEHLRLRKRDVTLLFTDIQASSAYWDRRGDLRGRLMIDFHNRLIFPIIKKNRGRIIKTIGDAVMAVFKRPCDAVTASVTIQQLMRTERRKNSDLPKIKIGIHSGPAIVEKDDVFGDVVNVAKRICDRARGGEILLSTRSARRMRQKDYYLTRGDRFKPKGKKLALTLYTCNWRLAPDSLAKLDPAAGVMLTRAQKWEIIAASAGSIIAILLLYLDYIRFFLLDSTATALFILDPLYGIVRCPPLALIPLGLIALGVYLLNRLKRIPVHFFRLVTGGLGFLTFYLLFMLCTAVGVCSRIPHADTVLYESQHWFVKTTAGGIPVFTEPNGEAESIRTVPRSTLLLQNDISEDRNWYKVLIEPKQYGWIIKTRPATIGIPERQVTLSDKFYFRIRDLYHLVFSLIGFFLGFRFFRLKPI